MIRLRIQTNSARALLTALAGRLAQPGELLRPAASVVAESIERNFDEEGRPLPWPPLSPATLRRKPAGLKILERTGRLRRSIRTRIEGGRLIASSELPYAAAHQYGAPRRRLPARPFLILALADANAVAQTVADSLSGTGHGPRDTDYGQ
jgi:phage virion morphogenesis protein